MGRVLHIMDASPLFYWNLPRMTDKFSLMCLKMVVYKVAKYLDENSDIVICSDSTPTVKWALVDRAKTDFKANRNPLTEFQKQCRGCFEYGVEQICRLLDITRVQVQGYESDDLIYAMQREYRHEYSKIVIHSADSDMLFMVDEKVSVDRDSFGYVTIDNYESIVNKHWDVKYNTITAYNICTKNKDNRGTLGSRTLPIVRDYMLQFEPSRFCKVEDTLQILSNLLNSWQFDTLLLAMPTLMQSEDYSKLIKPIPSNLTLLDSIYRELREKEYNKNFKSIIDAIDNYMGGNISV